MSKAWIDTLAEEIKQQGREAAEAYGREQHRAGIVAVQSKGFFTELALSLDQDFAEMRSRLQGSAVACETAVERRSPTELHLRRSRFPWFDARLKQDGEGIVLDYAKGPGVAAGQTLGTGADRRSAHFIFQVDGSDRMSVAETFAETPRQFTEAAELSQNLTEILFKG